LITHATTGANGMFTVTIPAGPSRVIELAYRAFANATVYAAQARLTESVSAGVLLHINSKQTRPTGTITLSGRVAGAIPAGGVNLPRPLGCVPRPTHGPRWPLHAPLPVPGGHRTIPVQGQGAYRPERISLQNWFQPKHHRGSPLSCRGFFCVLVRRSGWHDTVVNTVSRI
jgi:hypothetical protein